MTGSLVRDVDFDGVWHVFVDGFYLGKLFATETESSGTNYGWSNSSTLYGNLDEAYSALVEQYKALLTSK